jgi:hypothetical protein
LTKKQSVAYAALRTNRAATEAGRVSATSMNVASCRNCCGGLSIARTLNWAARCSGQALMSVVLVLHFALHGHIHTVDTGRMFASRQECTSAGEQAKSFANLALGERYSFSCRPGSRR